MSILTVFQFQQGSIITAREHGVLMCLSVSIPTRFNYNLCFFLEQLRSQLFQFQQGSIITGERERNNVFVGLFQFQQGSIITSNLSTDVPNSVVSIPTRFNYNFGNGRFRPPVASFQFQQGSIITCY